MLIRLVLAPAVAVVFLSPPAAAQSEPVAEVEATTEDWRRPLGSRNQYPLALFFVYLTPDRASVLPKGRTELGVALDYSNIIQEQSTEDELVRFDLEYLRTLVSVKRGFGSGLELGISVPFYVYYGGILDALVSSFHEGLGLPNHLRGQTPYGLVDYQYRRGDRVIAAGQEAFWTVGDVAFDAKKTVLERGPYTLAARGALKFPTGDPGNLSGSGATDVGLGLAFDRIGDRFGFYFNANYHLLGSSGEIETRNFFSFMLGADWRVKPRWAIVLQVDLLEPPIAGELRLLNHSAKQIALGARYGRSERFVYEWRLVEDLSSLSPDFTLAFEMGVRFPGGAR